MGNRLSAMKYIKNNKRRVAVLIVSLSLSFVLTYFCNFLLMSTEETFKTALLETSEKIQYARFAGSSLGVNIDNPDYSELLEEYSRKHIELAEKLKKYDGVIETYYSYFIYNKVIAAVGSWFVEIPIVNAEQFNVITDHYGAEIDEGRMPENPGEIVLDKAAMNNGDYEIGDYYQEDYYEDTFEIVGILKGENYWGCGLIPDIDMTDFDRKILILSDGSVKDVSVLIEAEGIEIRDTYDTITDYSTNKKDLKENVTDVIALSTDVVYIGIVVLLSIALFIVYTTYLRDRHNEWCLYSSIGYSRLEIYLSILRELLFTFGAAVLSAAAVTAVLIVATDYFMIKPAGLICRYIYPDTIIEMLCVFIMLFGLLQIPVRYALYKIRTVDAMDDDLY